MVLTEALKNGSTDNVTCQLLKVISLPTQTEDDILRQITELPFPPNLSAGMKVDGYELLRELHASKRSEVFLARNYSSPEFIDGQVSNRSDIFSLGVIAYELLTGAPPHGDHERQRPASRLKYTPARQQNIMFRKSFKILEKFDD